MPINVSRVPYPGKDNSCYGQNGLLKSDGISTQAEYDLINLLTSGGDTVLKRAYTGVCNGLDDKGSALQYDGCELWLYNGFHGSEGFKGSEDKDDHAAFRLFEDCDSPATKTPWNVRTYHLYKDGTSRAWTHKNPATE